MVEEPIGLVLKQIVCMLTLLLGISETLQLKCHYTKVLLKIAGKTSKKRWIVRMKFTDLTDSEYYWKKELISYHVNKLIPVPSWSPDWAQGEGNAALGAGMGITRYSHTEIVWMNSEATPAISISFYTRAFYSISIRTFSKLLQVSHVNRKKDPRACV